MKALSIKNPWAVLIAMGIKDVENRTWKTNYRGKVLIHVPQKETPLSAITQEQWDSMTPSQGIEICKDYSTSCIIGEVEIVDCIKNDESVWALKGHWHWVLDNAVMYDYRIDNVKGKLSFWNYENENPPKVRNDGFSEWCACDTPVYSREYGHNGYCSNCCNYSYH